MSKHGFVRTSAFPVMYILVFVVLLWAVGLYAYGQEDEGMDGIHIMADGTVMLGTGEVVETARVDENGMIIWQDGRVIKPLMDLRSPEDKEAHRQMLLQEKEEKEPPPAATPVVTRQVKELPSEGVQMDAVATTGVMEQSAQATSTPNYQEQSGTTTNANEPHSLLSGKFVVLASGTLALAALATYLLWRRKKSSLT